MKITGILPGFLPLIVYGVLAGSSVSSVIIALCAAAIVTVLAGFADLKKGMILAWTNLVLFCSLFVATGLLGMTGIIPGMGIIIYAVLAAVTFGSIVGRMPFTLQYAREMVDRALWDNPAFVRVNILMTGVWGGVFSINLLLDCIALAEPELARGVILPVTYVVLAAGIIFTIWYPGHIQKKHLQVPAPGSK
ncbi:MAG: hypothetical protein WC391_10175 [Methanoregula sp.]|jgi:hypothetical protein